MELYILDTLLRRREVIDSYESLIWTERYAAEGDFKLKIAATNETRTQFQPNVLLGLDRSDRVMFIKTVTESIDDDGNAVIEADGLSLESILRDRIVKDTLSNTTVEPKWVLTGTPGNIARTLFNDICVTGNLNSGDIIPLIQSGTMYPADTIAEPTISITVEVPLKTLYEAIQELCDIYDLGFRLTKLADSSKLYFNIYSGSDRTIQQTNFPAVVISPDLDNMRDTKEMISYAASKNVAYVFSPVGYEIVYADGTDTTVSGFSRRVLVVDATDITDTNPVIASALMIQKGKEELSKTRPIFAFDGEIDPNFDLVYGVDYGLGDLITSQNSKGVVNSMKITEQIFVCDHEGERSYPTISMRSVITPGSWLAWDYNQTWSDVPATVFWNNA